MQHRDAEKLAQECWDAHYEPPFAACQIEHQLKLCSVVNSIEEQLQKESPLPGADVEGLADFEAEVIKRLTAPAPAPKQLKAASKKEDK